MIKTFRLFAFIRLFGVWSLSVWCFGAPRTEALQGNLKNALSTAWGIVFLIACLIPAAGEAAAVGTTRVTLFKQGTSTNRAVGSMIGVWEWKGRTFANQDSNRWHQPFNYPSTTLQVRAIQFWRNNPSFACAPTDEQMLFWTGSTWWTASGMLSNYAMGGERMALGVFNSSFIVVAHRRENIWRWTGTSWIHDLNSRNTNLAHYNSASVFGTDDAWVFGRTETTAARATILDWRGTSWRIQMRQESNSRAQGIMIDTSYGWYLANTAATAGAAYQWTGTSWILHSTLGPWNEESLLTAAAVRYERDFAVFAGATGELWRWSGTSWHHEQNMISGDWTTCVAVQTDFAWIVGASGAIFQWTGTSWVNRGPLTTTNLGGVDATDTGFAIAAGGNEVWIWRGTSWVFDTTRDPQMRTSEQVATIGETATHIGGGRASLATKLRFNVLDDATGSGTPPSADWSTGGTLYRTVVQILPTDSDWDWNGESSDTDSYIGILNLGGNSYEFMDEQDTTTTGRRIVLETDAQGSGTVEDILIWEDTVGYWNGISENPHNGSSSTGIKLTEAGIVHNDIGSALNADVWGETDSRITSAQTVAGDNTWEDGTGSDTTVAANVGMLTWEYWHLFDAALAEGETLETAIRVEAAGSSTSMAGISWEYRVGHYKPRIGNWRWCRDDAANPEIMKEPRGRLENVGTTGERLRLRVRVDERDGGYMPSAIGSSGWELWWSQDLSTWTQLTTSSATWKLVDGQGTAGATVGNACMPEVDTLGINVESHTANNGVRQDGFTEMEMDFAIESSSASTNTIYYFEPRHNGHRAIALPGVRYPSVLTTSDSTFNYLLTRPNLGPFGWTFSHTLHSNGSTDPFKVVYVGTQSGASDQILAVSRTDGSILRSYSASGTLQHPNVYWDTTNSRYNLYFVQGGTKLLALTDNGTTIAANASWAADGLKDFTNLIGRPTRVFESGQKRSYLMLYVTSFQGNTSTLYKIYGADGSVNTDDMGYSRSAQGIGWNTGLRVTANLFPLWLDGTTYNLSAGNNFVKITAAGTATPDTLASIAPANFSMVRTKLSSGASTERVLGSLHAFNGDFGYESAARMDQSNMGGIEWNNSSIGGGADIADSDNIKTAPCVQALPLSYASPVFIGDTAQVNRLSGSQGTQETNFPYDLTGSISTQSLNGGIEVYNDWIYFGTDGGYIYALSATDPTQGAGTRFRVPGDFDVVGVGIDVANSTVYYTTEDGRLYQFDLR